MIGRFLRKARAAVEADGPVEGLKKLADDARSHIVEPDRDIVLLRVDLTEPRCRLRARDHDPRFSIEPFDHGVSYEMEAMLQRVEPTRAETVHARLDQSVEGYVARDHGDVVGYVFWVPGRDEPGARVHQDLEWLPMSPGSREVYTFDYFVAPEHRGRGNVFARAVQQAQFDAGFKASYGYVYAANTAALWLYRTLGWKEVGRVTEHRLFNKLVVIEDRLFVQRPFRRALVGRVPQALLVPLDYLGSRSSTDK